MTRRSYSHSSNPGFSCSESVLLLPFGRQSFLEAIVEERGGEPVEMDETTDRIVYTLPVPTGRVTLIYSGMGGPATANALEMASANGARRVALFGACGGVVPEVAVGDLLVATGAVRGEGTSTYYAPGAYPAAFDPGLVSALELQARRSRPNRVHRGVVYTTDASYRQGPEIYEQYAGLILGVECECAAAAVAGARLGLTMAALLFCTDNVTLPQEGDRAYRGLQSDAVRAGFAAGLEAVMTVLGETA